MADISNYKDTSVAKKFIKNYNLATLFLSIGILLIIVPFIPLLIIESQQAENKYIPTIIIAALGLLMIVVSNYKISSLKQANKTKYTVAAYDYVDDRSIEVKKIFRRDLIIGILIIILSVSFYFLFKTNTIIQEEYIKYFNSFLILLFAIGVFLIANSKGKRDALKYIKENI